MIRSCTKIKQTITHEFAIKNCNVRSVYSGSRSRLIILCSFKTLDYFIRNKLLSSAKMSLVITGNINAFKSTLAFRAKEIIPPDPEPATAKFHYRFTTITLFIFTLLVTSTYWIAGDKQKNKNNL